MKRKTEDLNRGEVWSEKMPDREAWEGEGKIPGCKVKNKAGK